MELDGLVLGTIGSAAALALAAVLAFAAVVAAFAAALAFTVVLALARVLGRLVRAGVAQAGLGGLDGGVVDGVGGGGVRGDRGSADHTRESGRQEQCIQVLHS